MNSSAMDTLRTSERRFATGLSAAALLLLIGGCAGTPSARDSSVAGGTPSASAQRRGASAERPPAAAERAGQQARPAIVHLATQMVGIPYRYGGTSPREGFDCSGLVHYTYARAGLEVPRTSEALYGASRKIALEDAAEGDLLFFRDQRKLSHVGIYLGEDRFVHAPSSGKNVQISSLSSTYYQTHLIGVGRLIGD